MEDIERRLGTYNIQFGVGTARRTITATVTAATPTITIPQVRTVNTGANFNMMSSVIATCPVDGNIVSRVTASPTSINTSNPGVHSVNYTVTNSDGVTVSQRGVVIVTNGNFTHSGNYIIQASNFSRRVGQVNTANAQIISAADARGWRINADRTTTAVTPTVSNNGGYTAAVGTYTIALAAGTASRNVTATVTAGNAPVLTVPGLTNINVRK